MKKSFLPHVSLVFLFMPVNGNAQVGPLAENGAVINSSGLTAAPSGFEENKGQVLTTAGDAAPFVRYRLTQGNTSIFLFGSGIAYQFNRMHYPDGYAELQKVARLDPAKQGELDGLRKEARLETYRMDVLLEGADADARITTEGRSEDYTQYYNHDALDVHTYGRVTYHDVYPGIDWVIHTTAKGMEYDFVLQPGADPSLIQLRFEDYEELRMDADGQLIHGNRMGRFTEAPPVSFQNGKEVDSHFVLNGDRLSFALGAYDHGQPLTIDPDRIWGTYYGGGGYDEGYACAFDGSGNVYWVGSTDATTDIASGGHQNTYGGGYGDAFLVQFNASGVRQWGTYYGGTEYDVGLSCALDNSGNVYLGGATNSSDAIASGGDQNTFGDGTWDAFLVKFNADGVRQWGTYCGGPGNDQAVSCAVDGSGNVYLAGTTSSETAIASGGHQNTYGGGIYQGDDFLVKYNSSGVRQWGTYYGGPGDDGGGYCAVDGSGNVYLAGWAEASDAIASGGHQDTFGGGQIDAFLVKFNSSGVRQWATYYGGADDDDGICCAVDDSGNVYLTGGTLSNNAIASGGHQNTFGGGPYDAFLVKFNANGVRQWGTYYGGTDVDLAYSCAVDGSGSVYLAGWTGSGMAIASNGYQNTYDGAYDAFLVKFNSSGVRQWGTYYGGAGDDRGYFCTTDGSGNVYLSGYTESDTAIASGGYQNTYGGSSDAFLVKFDGGSMDGISSLEEQNASFSIWPNPNTGDRFFLHMQETGQAEVQLFDALGELQHTEQLQLLPGHAPVEVTLGSKLAKGLYMVRVTVDGRSSAVPLMIQ